MKCSYLYYMYMYTCTVCSPAADYPQCLALAWQVVWSVPDMQLKCALGLWHVSWLRKTCHHCTRCTHRNTSCSIAVFHIFSSFHKAACLISHVYRYLLCLPHALQTIVITLSEIFQCTCVPECQDVRELAKCVYVVTMDLCALSIHYIQCFDIKVLYISYIPSTCRECNLCELLLNFLSCGDKKLVRMNIIISLYSFGCI